MNSFYEILEVSPSASTAEIRASYLKLAREYHPDRVPEHLTKLRADAEEKLKLVNEAWAVLSDAGKRRLYDEKLRNTAGESHKATPYSHVSPSTPRTRAKVRIVDLFRERKDMVKWALVVAIATCLLAIVGELTVLRSAAGRSGESEAPSESVTDPGRVLHFDLPVQHIQASQFGSREGLDVQLLTATVRDREVELKFRVQGGKQSDFLLYEPPGGSSQVRNVMGREVAVDRGLEELYLVDDSGTKHYSTTGLVGGKQANFDLYNFTRRISVGPREDVVLDATFPFEVKSTSSITFVSPALGKWQREWRWPSILLK